MAGSLKCSLALRNAGSSRTADTGSLEAVKDAGLEPGRPLGQALAMASPIRGSEAV